MFTENLTPKMIRFLSMNKLSYDECRKIYQKKRMDFFGF